MLVNKNKTINMNKYILLTYTSNITYKYVLSILTNVISLFE